MCLALWKPKATICTLFFVSGSKNHGIYSVSWPGYLRSFQHVARCRFICGKSLYFTLFLFPGRRKNRQKKYGSRIDICWAMLAQLTAAVRGPEKLASNLCFPPAQLRSFSALLAANTASLLAFVWHSAGPRAVSQSQNFNVAF